MRREIAEAMRFLSQGQEDSGRQSAGDSEAAWDSGLDKGGFSKADS